MLASCSPDAHDDDDDDERRRRQGGGGRRGTSRAGPRLLPLPPPRPALRAGRLLPASTPPTPTPLPLAAAAATGPPPAHRARAPAQGASSLLHVS